MPKVTMADELLKPGAHRSARIIYSVDLTDAERLYAMRLAKKLFLFISEEVGELPDEIRPTAITAALASLVDCMENHPLVTAAIRKLEEAGEGRLIDE